MHARLVEAQATRLHELRIDELGRLGLSIIGVAVALAEHGHPSLALPALAAAFAGAVLALSAFHDRSELLEELALESDAYAIRAVRAFGERLAALENRRSLAASIRWMLHNPNSYMAHSESLDACTEQLEELARELEDDRLVLDPACAATCERLLTDGLTSPLINRALPSEDALVRIRRIRAGFHAAARSAATPV